MTLYEKRIAPKKGSITRFTPYYYEENIKEIIRETMEEIAEFCNFKGEMDNDYIIIRQIIKSKFGEELCK